MKQSTSLVVTTVLVLCAACAAEQDGANLLKNGSFEGGKRYWFQAETCEVVKGDAAQGEYALRISKGMVQSAAFQLQPGKAVTISFSAKAEAETVIGWQCSPCGREIGAKAGLTWGLKAKHPLKVGTEWKRHTMTFTPNTPQDGFWPRPTYMLQIGDNDKPVLLDAITVAYGAGADAYVPRRAVEVQVDCPDLKGYRDATANTLEKGQTVNLAGSVSNPGQAERKVTLRWQFVDYEGERAVSKPTEKEVAVPPGKTITETAALPLPATGLVLARFSALENGQVVDSSDLPLTSLPYPKAAAKPDQRERFGASYFGPHSARNCARLGFAWSRWYPHTKWATMQPKGGEEWNWLDKEMDTLETLGISAHVTLYDRPKWAFAKDSDPLPRDMQWPADDKRWDDLTVQCAWDRFVTGVVNHYKGRSVIYEIENEPEFDGWDKMKDLYTKFTIRSVRLIKQTDPSAKVMVDNVYGIPSGLNRYLLERGVGRYLDYISWHDYHDGWLADATAIKRMRSALEDLKCGHIEIWFNEGWAYTNTAVDEPAVALTNHNAAQSTNAMVCSVAELTANGQEKTILFHSGYEQHGMSFWDYCGPGTMLWDFYGYPLPLVPAWNTLAHHIGLSKAVGFVRPEGANFCIFDDLRNGRGVMVAYADREAKADVTVELPLADLIAEDCMGNAAPLGGKKLVLSKTGRPVFLYPPAKTDGKTFAAALAPLDRKNASFVGKGGSTFRLPPTWEGTKKDSGEGNPALADGKPIWRLDQVWPPEPAKPENYRPLTWRDGWWMALKDSFGGQPKAEMKDSAIRMEFRAPHSASKGEKMCGLAFIAPRDGTFTVTANAELKLWDGANPVKLTALKKTKDSVSEIASLNLIRDKSVPVNASVPLVAGDELVLLPRISGMFVGGDVTLRGLQVALGGAGAGAATYRLPRAWEGQQKGTAEGNPIVADGKPVWRLDQVWPDKPMMAEYYTPLLWNGTEWFPEKNHMGGQPAVKVADGAFRASVRGSWTGSEGQRIAGLVFITPRSGMYRVTASARSKPWEGGAKTFKLALYKKDTQRATVVQEFQLPRSGEPVAIDVKVELTAGHELIFLPLMPDWHNATTTTVEDLTISEEQP
ncbi:MAG: carbohydrate binding domain-containing protein [Planctomycetota bacterium]|nr:carbohydrate binding domain-containing protein [Planctomycetota bacterium]